jgi:hypothetical protein
MGCRVRQCSLEMKNRKWKGNTRRMRKGGCSMTLAKSMLLHFKTPYVFVVGMDK